MIITSNQIAAFTAAQEEKANKKLVSYLKERFPTIYSQGDEKLHFEFVKKIRKTANNYKILKENDVATFLDFSVMYGEDFHQMPWAKDTLMSKHLYEPDKMALLRHYVKNTGVNL